MAHPFEALPGGLREAWQEPGAAARLRKLRRAALATREALLADGPVLACSTYRLVTFPYPTTYAFSSGALSPAPFVMMTNRMQIVQFEHEGRRKTLLFNPTDVERSRAAIFYADLARKFGDFLSKKVIPTFYGKVEEHLARAGLTPADVDYIAYDHLHVQDLRRWLGGAGPAYFPNAKLLVMKAEWDEVNDLHPMNLVWYVPDGCKVPQDRVVLLDGDVKLGRGVAILDTRGHTLGNMSLCVVTPDGPFVVSENGVAPESYAPMQSRIPGVRAYAERMGFEVVMNGNTRESSLDQYSSMIVEKTVAGPSKIDPTFPAIAPSSELTSSLLAPGLSPTFCFSPPDVGTIVPGARP
jgi:glyoxylase-like metal-dependent hydrolase (beta-lactamase superfamily II)